MKIICFWFEKPTFAFEGVLSQAMDLAPDRVISFCKNEVDGDRGGINSGSTTKYIFCHRKSVLELLKENGIDPNNTIHIVNGFYSFVLNELCQLKSIFSLKIICLTEPVSCMSKTPKLEYLYKILKYKKRKKEIAQFINGVIFLGQNGKRLFKTIKWDFPSTEISYMPKINTYTANNGRAIDSKGIFLYIGRNNLREKGLDFIIKWFTKNKSQELIIVGNYGNDSSKIQEIISRHPNIKRLNSMKMPNLFQFLLNENVKCILTPSFVDGCNVNNYLSIAAGIPCITTYNTNNYEMILKAKSGFVIKHSYKKFKKAVDNFSHLSDAEISNLSSNALSYSRKRNAKSEAERIFEFISTI